MNSSQFDSSIQSRNMNTKRSYNTKTPNKKVEENAVHHKISNLLSPYKASRTNTALLMVTALKEYRSTVGDLERHVMDLEIENQALRRHVFSCRTNPEDRLTSDVDSSSSSIQKMHSKQSKDVNLVPLQVPGDTSFIQRQALTSLMDYLNSEVKGDLEVMKLRASNALEALKDSMTDVHSEINDHRQDKVYVDAVNGCVDKSVQKHKTTTTFTEVTMEFLQKLTDHVGDAIDLKASTRSQRKKDGDVEEQSGIIIETDALIQALMMLMNERDKFIEELTTLYDMANRHQIRMYPEQSPKTT
jgi:hypothetical protein